MDEMKRLSLVLREAVKQKGMTLEKLEHQTGVSEKHLALLLEDKLEKLPAAPYVRGYLLRVGEALDLDGEKLWLEYLKNNETIRKSGKADKLPENRFISKITINKNPIIGATVLIIVGLIIFRFLSLDNPKLKFNNLEGETTNVETSPLTIEGTINQGYKLTLGGEELFVNEKGEFKKEVFLEPGFNSLVFKAKKVLGKEHTLPKQVFYEQKIDGMEEKTQIKTEYVPPLVPVFKLPEIPKSVNASTSIPQKDIQQQEGVQ